MTKFGKSQALDLPNAQHCISNKVIRCTKNCLTIYYDNSDFCTRPKFGLKKEVCFLLFEGYRSFFWGGGG